MTVETAVVILPFLLLTLMTVEVVLLEFYQAIFAKCVQDVARQIRTGQTDTYGSLSTTSAQTTQLITNICNDVGNYSVIVLPRCSTNTAVVVNVIKSGTTPQFTSGIVNQALVSSGLQSNNTASTTPSDYPGACSLVVFQAFYQWQILVPINRTFLNSGFSTPSFLFAAAFAFQDEPPKTGGGCSSLYGP